MSINFKDNSTSVLAGLNEHCLKALERIGQQAEGYAKDISPVDTGMLRNSITHAVDENRKEVFIGSNSEYAPYVEFGTGIYYPGGRTTPWVYKDAKGAWHTTSGQQPQPFIKPAVADHEQTYRNIIEDEFKQLDSQRPKMSTKYSK